VLFAGLAAVCLLALAQSAHAVSLVFTIDPAGTATGLPGIAPITANRGNYQSGSWLSLSGNISAVTSGVTASGPFVAQSAASGSFSSGSAGSLLDFFNGSLNVNIDPVLNTVSLPGGSSIDGTNFNAKYAANPVWGSTSPVNLAPAVNGGPVGGPAGSAPADLGVKVTLSALFGLISIPVTAALRGTQADLMNTAAPIPLSAPGPSQTFPTSGLIGLATTAGNFDYSIISSLANAAGTTSIATTTYTPTTDGNGTLTTTAVGGGTQYTISIPIQVIVSTVITGSLPATINTTFTGSVAAYAFVPAPEPGTLVLLGMGIVSLVPLGVRRWRRSRTG
jgi:hypothetical protein